MLNMEESKPEKQGSQKSVPGLRSFRIGMSGGETSATREGNSERRRGTASTRAPQRKS